MKHLKALAKTAIHGFAFSLCIAASSPAAAQPFDGEEQSVFVADVDADLIDDIKTSNNIELLLVYLDTGNFDQREAAFTRLTAVFSQLISDYKGLDPLLSNGSGLLADDRTKRFFAYEKANRNLELLLRIQKLLRESQLDIALVRAAYQLEDGKALVDNITRVLKDALLDKSNLDGVSSVLVGDGARYIQTINLRALFSPDPTWERRSLWNPLPPLLTNKFLLRADEDDLLKSYNFRYTYRDFPGGLALNPLPYVVENLWHQPSNKNFRLLRGLINLWADTPMARPTQVSQMLYAIDVPCNLKSFVSERMYSILKLVGRASGEPSGIVRAYAFDASMPDWNVVLKRDVYTVLLEGGLNVGVVAIGAADGWNNESLTHNLINAAFAGRQFEFPSQEFDTRSGIDATALAWLTGKTSLWSPKPVNETAVWLRVTQSPRSVIQTK